ncbi:hypothetical protein THASP1DRAFT_26050 [Thamnocephalis sphaerospora]|uniref:Inhibitor I9 domain-containing protein n=1 Tax=Thamnocephalis sphaerospora TaxID=78915 RepID=A0A4P9XIE3_9FUNG|nr:hypothetical protein THASP1DRAFT_26050 [Thamnocephalis sphaerospora]|eukprot:RKP05458.1 hypothetical protein THASP1DRAFT_26050 [Thamnocephalis sphaerospora]
MKLFYIALGLAASVALTADALPVNNGNSASTNVNHSALLSAHPICKPSNRRSEYIVELEEDKSKTDEERKQQRKELLDTLRKKDKDLKLRFEYDLVLNGFSVSTTLDRGCLKGLPGVERVSDVEQVSLPKFEPTNTNQPATPSFGVPSFTSQPAKPKTSALPAVDPSLQPEPRFSTLPITSRSTLQGPSNNILPVTDTVEKF